MKFRVESVHSECFGLFSHFSYEDSVSMYQCLIKIANRLIDVCLLLI